MKPDRATILQIIIGCTENLNESLVEQDKISTHPEEILFGEHSSLDSMGLLNLLMDLEEKLEDEGMRITILDDQALSQSSSPFRSISALTSYICGKLQNEA